MTGNDVKLVKLHNYWIHCKNVMFDQKNNSFPLSSCWPVDALRKQKSYKRKSGLHVGFVNNKFFLIPGWCWYLKLSKYSSDISSHLQEKFHGHSEHLKMSSFKGNHTCRSHGKLWSPLYTMVRLLVFFSYIQFVNYNNMSSFANTHLYVPTDCVVLIWGLLHKTFYRRKLRLLFTRFFSCVKVNGRIMLTWLINSDLNLHVFVDDLITLMYNEHYSNTLSCIIRI